MPHTVAQSLNEHLYMKEQFTEYPRSALLQTVTDKEQTEKETSVPQADVIFSKVIG